MEGALQTERESHLQSFAFIDEKLQQMEMSKAKQIDPDLGLKDMKKITETLK